MKYEDIKVKPCPFCGHVPFPDNFIDSFHPVNCYEHYDEENEIHYYDGNPKNATCQIYRFSCLENEGGCGASIKGYGPEDTIARWNRRV